MKIMWVCSFAPTAVAKAEDIKQNRFGGWIDGALSRFEENTDLELCICFPQRTNREGIIGRTKSIDYCGFYIRNKNNDYDKKIILDAENEIKRFQPEVIHLWGAEFPWAYAVLQAATSLKVPTICSIQGLCGVYADHYYGFIPGDEIKHCTIRDIIRRDSIKQQKKRYEKRGQYERLILSTTKHIIGRTDWDKSISLLYKNAKYHYCNETLRNVFYEKANQWSYDNCEHHSIFVSQANYPIKGFHMAIEALKMLKDKYDDVMLYTTGESPFDISNIRLTGYQRYLKSIILSYGLKDSVIFVGPLDANSMCDMFLKSHVFVSPSSIENSPNSVGEAMLLGMPIVASYVGGTMNLITNISEGYLYQADAPYMLAYYIDKVFAMGNNAKEIGRNAFIHANSTHNIERNHEKLLSIYEEILME